MGKITSQYVSLPVGLHLPVILWPVALPFYN